MPKKIGIKLCKRDDSEVWQYYIRYKGNTYRGSTGEKDKSVAEEKAYRIQYDITKQADVERAGSISIDECIAKYLEFVKKELRRETLKSYTTTARNLKKFLNDRLPKIKLLKEVDEDVLDGYKLWQLELITKTTVRNNIKNLKRMFTWAYEKKYITVNPLKEYRNLTKKQVRKEQTPPQILTVEELEQFAKHTKKHYPALYPLYMVYMYTGARKKELLLLEWDDVDFDNKLIRIRYKEGFIPKTDERTIPLHKKLVEILTSIPRISKQIFMDGKKPFMYTDKTKSKGVYESHKPHRILRKITQALGRPTFTRLHWLRHSYATIIAKEKGIKFAQEILGHKDIKVTERYIHFDRDYLQENLSKIKALDKIFK